MFKCGPSGGPKMVCLACRLVFGSANQRCPVHQTALLKLGASFRPPRKGDDRAWREVEREVARGVKFHGSY